MKKIISSLCILLIALTWIFSAIAEQTINNCPIPGNMKIIAPDKNEVPPKLALLSGIWEGNWASSAIFIVEQIKEKEAVVVLAWAGVSARSQAGQSFAPGFVRLKCPIEAGEDGNYRIICTLKTGTNRLIQTNDPSHIRVVRDGFGTMSDQYRDSTFRKKEMK
jgi:hypothetical protein